jgi:integrase
MARHGNGEGTIVPRYRINKDGERYQAGWKGALTLSDNTRKWLYGETRQEVARKLASARRDRDKGLPVLSDQRMTVAALLDDFLAMKRVSRSYRTWLGYTEICRNHLIPAFGKKPVSSLTPIHLQRFYAEKLDSGLSSTTTRHIHACLRAALEYGVKHGVIARNVAAQVDAPKFAHFDRRVLSADEAQRLMDTAKGTRWAAIYVLVLSTGLREGELLGLRWRYVDLERGTLTVFGNVQPGVGGLVLKEPKNLSSARIVKLPQIAVQALREHRTRQDVERLGEFWQERDLVFPNTIGGLMRCQGFLKRYYKPMLANAGIPYLRFHDLRHSAATLLVAMGVHLSVVSQILGHSSIKVTSDLYTHVSVAMQQPASDAMDALFGEKSVVAQNVVQQAEMP